MTLFRSDPLPILITALNVPISHLSSEGGGSSKKAIAELEELVGCWPDGAAILNSPGAAININFRLVAPLGTDSFSIEYLDQAKEKNMFDW